MSIVEHLMNKNVEKLPPNCKDEIMDALYDKYAREVHQKVEEISANKVKQANARVDQVEKEKALFKAKANRIEKDFHNLIKYLEGQGYDVNWNTKKPETPVVKSLQENEEHEPAVPPPETPAQGKDWQLCLQLKIHENDHFS